MSTQQQPSVIIAGAELVRDSLAVFPSVIDFLPAESEASFVPVNCNKSWARSAVKRALDLIIAVPALIVVSPLLAVLALLVWIDSAGPVFFVQKRNGLCGRPFEILKFRTMHVLENGDSVVQARDGDPRTTRIGRWLRHSSLDELPQLINVVRGDMSLVGPRPHARAHDAYYSGRIAAYKHRHAVKPGITGWAQINGRRGPTPTIESMSRRVDLDVWYVKNASFALDLKILLRTPLEILRPRNAF